MLSLQYYTAKLMLPGLVRVEVFNSNNRSLGAVWVEFEGERRGQTGFFHPEARASVDDLLDARDVAYAYNRADSGPGKLAEEPCPPTLRTGGGAR